MAARPIDKDYYLNLKIPTGVFIGLSSTSKGIKDSNGQTAKYNNPDAHSLFFWRRTNPTRRLDFVHTAVGARPSRTHFLGDLTLKIVRSAGCK